MVADLRPLGEAIDKGRRDGELSYGQVVWGGSAQGQPVGLAWDWCEIRSDVILMADPMTVITNLCLTDEEGEPLSEREMILLLNNTIHELEWQGALRTARERRAAAAVSRVA
jgi:hypothetical protein